jgi:HlyD family secretion protein
VNTRSIWLIFFSALGVLGASTIFALWRPTQELATPFTVSSGQVHAFFHASGQLVYREQVRLSPELVAKVTRIPVKVGDKVEAGQILAQLDDASVRAEISQAEARLAQSRIDIARLEQEYLGKQRDLARSRELQLQGMVSRERIDAAEVASKSAGFLLDASRKTAEQDEAALQQKNRMLDRTVIRSPMRGTVVSLSIKPGETAVASAQGLAGSELMQIANLDGMVAQASVAEYDLARVRLGQEVTVSVPAIPEQTYRGKVLRISQEMTNSVDPSKTNSKDRAYKSVPVLVLMEASDRRFIAGLSCDLQFHEAGRLGALVVPISAIRFDDDSSLNAMMFGGRREPYVWILSQGQVNKRKIVLGVADEQRQEVHNGLKAGEVIVAGPAALLAKLTEGKVISARADKGQ